jgi:site-specific recombinase XerC
LGHASLSNKQKYVHLSVTDVIGKYDKARPRT